MCTEVCLPCVFHLTVDFKPTVDIPSNRCSCHVCQQKYPSELTLMSLFPLILYGQQSLYIKYPSTLHVSPTASLSLSLSTDGVLCVHKNLLPDGVTVAERTLIQLYQLTVPHFTVYLLYLSSEHQAHQTSMFDSYVKYMPK
jgi:hypothetical protein